MDTTTTLLALLTAGLAWAAIHAWRLRNEKRDIVALAAIAAMLGAGTAVAHVL